ncbi:MAG: hypothetical protein ACLU37_09460 [Collinsella sp.]
MRGSLHHVTRLCVGNGLGIECAQGVEHACAARSSYQRHLADAAVDAHLAHTIDFAAEL